MDFPFWHAATVEWVLIVMLFIITHIYIMQQLTEHFTTLNTYIGCKLEFVIIC